MIVSKFLNYLLTPYLTRVMADCVYGQVQLMYAAIPFLNVVLSMGLSTAYFRWAGKSESQQERNVLFTSVLKFVSLLALGFFILSVVLAGPIDTLFGYGKSWYVIVVGALVAVDNINSVGFSGLRQDRKASYYTIINVTNVIVNLTLCILFYSLIPNAATEPGWVLIANLCASLVSTAMLAPWVLKHIEKPDRVVLKSMLIFSVPLMLGGLMGISNDFIDRQFMKWLLPAQTAYASIGIYASIAKIAALIMILRQIFTLGAEPFFLQKYPKEEFLQMNAAVFKYFLIVGLSAVLVILLYLDYFLLIVGEGFRSGAPAAAPLLAANLMTGLVISLSFWYKAEGKSAFAIKITVWGFLTAIVAALILIPRFDYMGAACAQMLSAAAMLISSYLYNQKYSKTPYEIRKIILYCVSAVAIYYLSLAVKAVLATAMYNIVAGLMLLGFVATAALIELKQLKR